MAYFFRPRAAVRSALMTLPIGVFLLSSTYDQVAAGSAPNAFGRRLVGVGGDASIVGLAQARSRSPLPSSQGPAAAPKELPVPERVPLEVPQPGIIRRPVTPLPEQKVAPPVPPAKPGARSRPSTQAPAAEGERRPSLSIVPEKAATDEMGREVWVPVDSRSAVSASDLNYLPYSAIGQINTLHVNGVQAIGTGFLVGPGIVLTAAHVLNSPRAGPAEKVTFTPGCSSGAGKRDVLSQTVGRESYRIANGWISSSYSIARDYGVLVLPQAAWHASCGWLQLQAVDETFLDRHIKLGTNRFVLAGFPSDKALGTQWVGRGNLLEFGEVLINHQIDTETGQSGSPIVAVVVDEKLQKKIPAVIAIHSRVGAYLANYNSARRIDRGLLSDVRRLVAELGRRL